MAQTALAQEPLSQDKLLHFAKTSDKADVFFYSEKDDISDFLTEKETDKVKVKQPVKCYTRPSSSNFSGLAFYYQSLAKFPSFSREEEIEIFRQYTRLKRRIKRIHKLPNMKSKVRDLEKNLLGVRNEIIERNLKFVVKLAKSFWKDGNPENFENLVSAGNIGLIRAIDRFDPQVGVRFLTYAANWIALEIRMEIANSNLIYIPIWWQKILKKLNAAYNQLSKSGDKVPVKQLAEKADVSLRHIIKLCDHNNEIGREQLPLIKSAVPFCEKTHTTSSANAEEACINKNACVKISTALGKLKPTERMVLNAVYGLGGKAPQNLRQVSNVMGNTGERVRQLKVKGVASMKKKLSSPLELGGLGIDNLQDIL